MNAISSAALTFLAAAILTSPLLAQREEFTTPRNGANHGVWRITHEPAIRHWANYHNTQCWSHDGRYLCYTRWAPDRGQFYDGSIEVHVYDAHRDESRLVERGVNPRWARHSNRLFYVRYTPRSSTRPVALVEVRQFDLATGAQSTIAEGAIEELGEPTHDDAWLIGARRFRDRKPEYVTVRIGLGPKPVVEELPQVVGRHLLPNPRHPIFYTKDGHKDEPFGTTRWFYDLDGGNQRMAVPTVQQCHMCWLGNGEFLLLGNGLVRGRRWNQPFPSNVEVLAGISVGDISPCGPSGRYVCSDRYVADLRSGAGWAMIDPLTQICYPAAAGDMSENYDADPKGSPDGTKIAFVTNYDLKDGPLAFLAGSHSADATTLKVDSTDGFPGSGHLMIQEEVLAYASKTPTSFEGITRTVHATQKAALRDRQAVTSFDARLMTDEQWASVPGATPVMRRTMPEGSPLLRQRQTDLHVVVVRRPDRPVLQKADGGVRLVPGEEHFETRGYHLLKDGARITKEPLLPGTTRDLDAGEYRAVAVEWSGLESEPGLPLKLDRAEKLTLLTEVPADFVWTKSRWLVGSTEVPENRAKVAAEAVREVVHRHDGVIRREWHRAGVLTAAHDLDAKGNATRRLAYEGGRLARREYFDAAGVRLSTEHFDSDGYVTESIRDRPGKGGADHWWFDRGMPVRRVIGSEEYHKDGKRWVLKKTGKP